MIIKTKIVATVGPASWDMPILTRLAKEGVDVFRINFSHGTRRQHETILKNIRKVQDDLGGPLAVLADLCGPKIRIGQIKGGSVLLAEGAEVTICRRPVVGTARKISTTLSELIDDVRTGQTIHLDDGKIRLEVVKRRPPSEIVCRVVIGGVLASGKGVNLPATNLKLSALTEKDRSDARWIARNDIDFAALSFVRRAADVRALRQILRRGRSDAKIIAKIEKPQAMKNIDGIVEAADGIMVARGDLGVEMALEEVPLAQKRLVQLCERAGKVCIVATQMLETMTDYPTPTRAEVSDVANAVLDGADAVMLSGETAVGKYPEKAVRMMDTIAERTEEFLRESPAHSGRRLEDFVPTNGGRPSRKTKATAAAGDLLAVAKAVRALVHSEDVRGVAVFTLSGNTAGVLSKMRLPVPILALTPHRRVMQQMGLLYGVKGCPAPICQHTREVLDLAGVEVRRLSWGRKGEKIVVVSGRPLGKSGTVNTLVVHTI
ncbi:MAG: pyruvate kinase [Planctomycetota bacterium]